MKSVIAIRIGRRFSGIQINKLGDEHHTESMSLIEDQAQHQAQIVGRQSNHQSP